MIDYDIFLDWIQSHFSEFRCKSNEIKINSIFTHDRKFHLWCNPSKNAYNCWKSGESGNLIQLVAQVDGCDLRTAAEVLGVGNPLRTWDAKIEELYGIKEKPIIIPDSISFPPNTFKIVNLSETSTNRIKSTDYLNERKIPVDDMYVCCSGKYSNRIVIPYRGKTGNLIYWNARDITKKSEVRYLGPDREDYKVGKEDVIYFYKWANKGSLVHITEGEFDSISLVLAGFESCAVGGKEIFEKQIEILLQYRVCLCFDNDERGREALHNVGNKLLRNGLTDMTFVRPPSQYKDWNKMLTERGEEVIYSYVNKARKAFDNWTSLSLFR